MKIVEALHKRKNIEKRILAAQQQLGVYSSAVSTEKPAFGSEEAQKKEVASIVQSINDLVKEFNWLSEKISITNLKTIITINGITASIHTFLEWKRKGCEQMIRTYNSLNEMNGQTRLRNAPVYEKEAKPFVMKFYDEKDKNSNLRKYSDLKELITPQLEVINATTDLIESDLTIISPATAS